MEIMMCVCVCVCVARQHWRAAPASSGTYPRDKPSRPGSLRHDREQSTPGHRGEGARTQSHPAAAQPGSTEGGRKKRRGGGGGGGGEGREVHPHIVITAIRWMAQGSDGDTKPTHDGGSYQQARRRQEELVRITEGRGAAEHSRCRTRRVGGTRNTHVAGGTA